MRRWIIIVLAVGLIAGLWAWSRTRPQAFETVRPTIGTVREFIVEDGKTRLDQEYLVTMPIDGRVRRIRLEEGDYVTSGDVAARIDDFDVTKQIEKGQSEITALRSQIKGVDIAKPKPQDIEAARLKVDEAKLTLEGSRKDIDIAQINLTNAEREFRRAENLLASGVVNRAKYDEAKRAFDTAREQLANAQIAQKAREKGLEIARANYDRIRDSVNDNEYMRKVYLAQIEQVESQLAILNDQLAKTEIRAPVTGVVLEKMVEDEQVLRAGSPLFKLGDMKSIEVESDILSEEVGRVREGQSVELTGKALQGRVIEGQVKRIYPTGFKKISALGIEQQRVKVIIGFDNGKAGLRPYVSLDVRIIITEHRDVLTAPEQATFKNNDQWSVFVIENGRLVLRRVEVGLRNDRLAEIVSGLTPNDVVVAEPSNEMQAGLRAKSLSQAGKMR
jgi:HlyD family secretion protein